MLISVIGLEAESREFILEFIFELILEFILELILAFMLELILELMLYDDGVELASTRWLRTTWIKRMKY